MLLGIACRTFLISSGDSFGRSIAPQRRMIAMCPEFSEQALGIFWAHRLVATHGERRRFPNV
jgi:hypothetical protein